MAGPAASMAGSLVWCEVSITSLLSKTRHASFTAVEVGVGNSLSVCVCVCVCAIPVKTCWLTCFSSI